jgi:hypothetical protein
MWSAATEVPQHVKKSQTTSSTGPSITPNISSRNTHIYANDSLDVLSNELLFIVAEHLLDEVQNRFEDDELPPTTFPGCRDGPPFSNEFEINIWDSKAVFAQDPSAASVIALKTWRQQAEGSEPLLSQHYSKHQYSASENIAAGARSLLSTYSREACSSICI